MPPLRTASVFNRRERTPLTSDPFPLGKHLLCVLLEHAHRADVRDGTVADAGDAELGQSVIWRHTVHDHHVDGKRYAIADPTDQRIVSQAGNEETGRARGCVRLGSVEGFTKRLCRVAALGKKQVGPRIDEERHSLLLGRLANDGDAACLLLEVVTFNDPVFKVDADHAEVEKTRDVVGQFASSSLYPPSKSTVIGTSMVATIRPMICSASPIGMVSPSL